MRLPGRCIIHAVVSDRSKINRPDRTPSNRAFTVPSFLLLLPSPCDVSSVTLKRIDKLHAHEGAFK